MFQVHCGGAIDGGPLLTKEYPIKYSLQWFLPKPSHGGFGNFSPLVPMQEQVQGVLSLKYVMKSTAKKYDVWKQAIWLPLSSPSPTQKHKNALAEIPTWDPDHNPEHTYALDHWAMAPLQPPSFFEEYVKYFQDLS